MSTQVQYRRGSTAQNDAFTGALAEITVDTTNNTLRVHDGITAGGYPVVGTTQSQTLTNKTLSSPTVTGTITGNLVPAANLTYNLGSSTAYWNNLYLAGNTIYLGNLQLKNNGDGALGVYQSDGVTRANVSISEIVYGNTIFAIPSAGGNAIFTIGGVSSVLSVTPVGINVTGNITATQTINANGNINAAGNITVAHVESVNTITASGNISGNYFIGNGSQLTGIDATAIQNGTANVRTFLNGNVAITAAGTANVLVVSGTGSNITGTLDVTGNVTGGNLVTAGLVSATGNVTGGNLVTAGLVSAGTTITATGNITGGNVLTSGVVTATGNVTGGNLVTAGVAAVTGNVTGGNLVTAGLVSAGTTITATGNITGGNLVTAGVAAVTGNVTGGNLVTAGLVSATGNITGGNLVTAGLVSATGNITGGNLVTTGLVSAGTTITATGNVSGGNITTSGQVAAVGNISGNYLLGNAFFVTGLSPTRIYNGTSEINIGTSGGNANISIGGTANVLVAASTGIAVSGFISNVNMNSKNITSLATPVNDADAATKLYVDNLVSTGIHYHTPVRVESPTNLNATYNNGASGVGATLTNAGANAALSIDGISLNTNDRVLVYQQTNQVQNGVYTVTTVGNGSTAWVLTRATDADSYAPSTADGLDEGSYFYVQEGATGAGESYVCSTVGTITFGTTNITFAQFSASQVYQAGTGLTLTNTTFSVNASQTQITSVGTLGSLAVTGNISGGNISVTGIAGTLSTAAQPNITSVGTLTSLAVSGNLSSQTAAGNTNTTQVATTAFVVGQAGGATPGAVGSAAVGTSLRYAREDHTHSGVTSVNGSTGAVTGIATTGATLAQFASTTSAQLAGVISDETGSGSLVFATSPTLITPILGTPQSGTLTSCTGLPISTGVSGLAAGIATFLATPSSTNLASAVTDETGSGSLVFATSPTLTTPNIGAATGTSLNISTGTVTLGGIVNANANGVGNIGSSTTYFNTVFAKATSAQYADLAEMYESDADYEPGTVVSFGGTHEITKSRVDGDTRIAGVISTNPSYLMNATCTGENTLPVAMVGRVPTWVRGPVRKGDMMVSDGDGRARASATPSLGSVIGKALEDFDGNIGIIEVVIGRL